MKLVEPIKYLLSLVHNQPFLNAYKRERNDYFLRYYRTVVSRQLIVSLLIIKSVYLVTRIIVLSDETDSNSGNGLEKEEIILARTLIIVVVVFLVCQSIKLVPDTYDFIFCHSVKVDDECRQPTWITKIIKVCHLLLVINSSCNFVIYNYARKQCLKNVKNLVSRRKSITSFVIIYVPSKYSQFSIQ